MPVRIPVVERILQANEDLAGAIRSRLDRSGLLALNLMASPGAGKTTLIQETVARLRDCIRIGYVDGDIATTLDAERVAQYGLPVVQVNTGGDCHLDAAMLSPALDQLPLDELDLLLVENVGNLVCPVNFRLGTHTNVLIASVPEGDDKPFKYPGMYRGVDVLVLNKIDLLPYIPFDVERFLHGVRVLNPDIAIFRLSALTGDGLDAWVAWLAQEVATFRARARA
jgi:hydrogenase nickel incorporation protein HypB